MTRAARPEVRNPVLALDAARALADLDPAAREALRALLRDLSADARIRADHAWRTHKGPMAAYWKACAVYARHIALAIPKDSTQ
jgi:hypothetical protein